MDYLWKIAGDSCKTLEKRRTKPIRAALSRFFHLWIKGSGVALVHEADHLAEIMMIKQFLHVLLKCLHDKDPKTISEASILADQTAPGLHASGAYIGGTIEAKSSGKAALPNKEPLVQQCR